MMLVVISGCPRVAPAGRGFLSANGKGLYIGNLGSLKKILAPFQNSTWSGQESRVHIICYDNATIDY